MAFLKNGFKRTAISLRLLPFWVWLLFLLLAGAFLIRAVESLADIQMPQPFGRGEVSLPTIFGGVASPATGAPPTRWEVTDCFDEQVEAFHWLADTHLLLLSSCGRLLVYHTDRRTFEDVLRLPSRALPDRLAVSADGTRAVIGDWQGGLYLVSLQPPRILQVWDGFHGDVTDIAITPDGKTVAAISEEENEVKVWQITGGRVVSPTTFSLVSHRPQAVALSPDGGRVVVGTADGWLFLWNMHTRAKQGVQVKQRGITDVGFLTQQRVLFASEDATVNLWDISQHRVVRHYDHAQQVLAMAVNADVTEIVATARTGAVRVWRMKDGQILLNVQDAYLWTQVGFSPSGEVIAALAPGEALYLWNAKTGEVQDFIAASRAVSSHWLSISADGTWLAVSRTNGLQVWNSRDGGQIHLTAPLHDTMTTQGVFSPTDLVIAAGTRDGRLVVWDLSKEQTIAHITAFDAPVVALAFVSQEDIVAVSRDGMLATWQWRSGKTQYRYRFPDVPTTLALVAQSNSVAVGTWGGKVYVLSLPQYRLEQTFDLDPPILRLFFTSDGRYMVAASDEQFSVEKVVGWEEVSRHHLTERLWDIVVGSNGKQLLLLTTPTGTSTFSQKVQTTLSWWPFPPETADTPLYQQRLPIWAFNVSLDPQGRFLLLGSWWQVVYLLTPAR